MAQKSGGYIEMVWTCPNCQTKNRGSVRYCSSCGAPHPKDVQFERPVEINLISDEKKISEAAAGPDIYCAFCGNRNPSTAKTCGNCGADLGEGEVRKSGTIYSGETAVTTGKTICGACGAENPNTALTCGACGSPLNTSVKAEQPAAPAKKGSSKGCIIALIILAAILGVVFYLFMKTDSKVAKVTDKNWKTSIAIQEVVTKHDSNWRDRVPSNGRITRCYDQARRTSSTYIAGAVESCGEPYFVDQGNGYSKQVQDCTYTVYDDMCDYTYRAWDTVDSISASGNDDSPYYPALNLNPGQREGERSEAYFVKFTDADANVFNYSPQTLDEYVSLKLNAEYTLEVNLVGGVVHYEAK